uniref:WD_REPEATS_REGION domain-containing protein n=1 Tax=Glossina austeni TaxID=7395 RepID=A0A1A9V9D6_GLOAU
MSLTKIFLRYYPPGIALNYKQNNGEEYMQHIDLLDLTKNTNPDEIVRKILSGDYNESQVPATTSNNNNNIDNIISPNEDRGLKKAIAKLQRKLQEPTKKKFYIHTRSDAHILPLTNVAFDRIGERCLTGSYDRTCRIINTQTGCEEHVLREHNNVVFSVAFNLPKCDRVVTGSFDGTAKIWSASSGLCRSTYVGHTAEVVAAIFHPINNKTICTASMDSTARIFDVETTQELQNLSYHGAEVITTHFSRDGNLLLTGSFDRTAAIWDIRSKR